MYFNKQCKDDNLQLNNKKNRQIANGDLSVFNIFFINDLCFAQIIFKKTEF